MVKINIKRITGGVLINPTITKETNKYEDKLETPSL